MTTSPLKDYARHAGVLLLYGLAAIIIRAPYWFTDRFNWDESTFLVVGASLLDGHLPYTATWDIKPPFTFGWMALFLATFGDSIVSVRLGGTLFVLGTAFFVYLIASRFADRAYAILAGLVQIALASYYFSGQSVMSEHLAMLPALAAIYFLMRGRPGPATAMTMGVLVAVAVLTRMNMAYLALALGMLVFAAPGYASIRQRFLTALSYALGGLAVAGIVALIYLIDGHWHELWFSVVDVSVSYASEQAGLLQSGKNIARALLGPSGKSPWLRLAVVAVAVPGAALTLMLWWKRPDLRFPVAVFYVSLAALGLSILSSGGGHAHYALQLAPYLSVFLAVALSRLMPDGRPRAAAIVFTLMLIALGMGPGVDKARFLWQRDQAGLPLTHGPSFWAADVIRAQGLDDYSIYAMERNLLYWILKKPVPVPLVTHPSNIAYPVLLHALYDEDTKPIDVLRLILDQEPTFIIRREAYSYFAQYPEAEALLARVLQGYTEIGRNEDLAVYMANDARDVRPR